MSVSRHGVSKGADGVTSAPLGAAAAVFRVPEARSGAGVGAFLLAILTAGALAHVGVRLKGLEVAYDLGRERHIATEMEEQRRRLQIEVGMLKDPRRVIAIARDKLNMGPPTPEAIWRLGSGRSVEEMASAVSMMAMMAMTTPPVTTGKNGANPATPMSRTAGQKTRAAGDGLALPRKHGP